MSDKTQDVVASNSLIAGSGYGLQQQYGGIWDGQTMMPAPRPVGKVYAAILAVMGELSEVGIPKGQSAAFEYGGKPRAFRGIDDVMQKLSALLVKHKLLVMPWLETHAVDRKEKQNKSGGTTITHIYTCVWRYKFISVEDGSTHEIRVVQETFDTSDKGLGKNMSYAYKYAMLQALCVPVEGNEEQDAHSPTIGDEAPRARSQGDYGFGGEYGQDDSHHAPPRRQETKPESRSEKRPSQNVAPRQGQTQTVPRMKGNEKTYAHAGKFANELTDELLYSRIRQLAHMKNLPDYAGMPEHLAELKKYAATRGIVNFDRKTEEAYPPAEIPEHLYVCVMPGKASFQKDIRSEDLSVEQLTKYLIMLEGDTRMANKPERIKLVQQEIQVRLSRDADRQDADNRTMP